MKFALVILSVMAVPVFAETVVPTRTIRANAIILSTDVTVSAAQIPNGYRSLADVVGQEARVVLYPGRPILVDDVGPPAIVTQPNCTGPVQRQWSAYHH